MIGIIESEVN